VRARNDYFEGISKENYISKVDNCIIDILDKIEEYDFEKEISFLESIIKIIKIFFDKNNSDKFIKILSANENM
jgi:hypothetical protein